MTYAVRVVVRKSVSAQNVTGSLCYHGMGRWLALPFAYPIGYASCIIDPPRIAAQMPARCNLAGSA
jgi:hypothetical protein